MGEEMDQIATYLQEISIYEVLTDAEEQGLVERLKTGDEEARTLLVQHNLKLVVNIAKRYANTGIELAELIQVGNTGLLEAVRDFVHAAPGRFSNYAGDCIRHEIVDLVRIKPIVAEQLEAASDLTTDPTETFIERGTLVDKLNLMMDTLEPLEKAILYRIAEGYTVSELGRNGRLRFNRILRKIYHPSRIRLLTQE